MDKGEHLNGLTKANSGSLGEIDFLQVKKSSLIFRAINNDRRQEILKLLEDRGKLTVTQIYVKFRVEQSIISQHLAILRRSGFVKTTRDGKNILYTVNSQRLIQVKSFIESMLIS